MNARVEFAKWLLDEIRSRVPISDIVGQSVAWDKTKSQPSKGDWWGLCPFHGEKSPSFHCEDDKGRYHCFGCGASGDHFRFLTETEGLSFPDAVRRLAERAGVSLPEPEKEGEEDYAARAKREADIAHRRRKSEADQARKEAEHYSYRDRERAKASGKWKNGAGAPEGSSLARIYLGLRLGMEPARLPLLPFLRGIAIEPYWHGSDEGGRSVAIHEGPAMVAPFVDPDGAVIGCHLTWVQFDGRKGRPRLVGEGGAPLPTKKMRGSKKGGLIPLVGFTVDGDRIVPELGRTRLAIGEGIENTLAAGAAEGFRRDTLYAAAGDLGNLAGPADPKSGFAHPELTRPDVNGKERALRVQGPVPKPGQDPGDAVQVPDQVDELLLIADGDSEPYATGAAMLRAKARVETADRVVAIAWPPAGADFADLLTRTSEAA